MKVAIVAGHLRSENLTVEGLCPAIANDKTVTILRASTGSRGEREYCADFAFRLADALRAEGFDTRPVDCTYDATVYATWKPDLVLAIHYHRDPNGRAMFAVPDPALGFHSTDAHIESARLEARIEGKYQERVGIPLSEDLVTLNMTQLYTWCFIPKEAQALICELGNANLDAAALYNDIGLIVTYLRDCVMEHFGVDSPVAPAPQRRASDLPPTIPLITTDTIASSLEGLAKQLRELPK